MRQLAAIPLLVLCVAAVLTGCGMGSSEDSESEAGERDRDLDGVAAEIDCDDANALVHSEQLFYLDGDRDGRGAGAPIALCEASAPSGYAAVGGDCDDRNGSISEAIAYYRDNDRDAYGAGEAEPLCQLSIPHGYSTSGDDPNDFDYDITPHDLDGDLIVNDLDSCPITVNDLVDLDGDDVDDACDTLVDLSGLVIRDQVLELNALNTQGEPVRYLVEDRTDPERGMLRVSDGGHLIVWDGAELSLERDGMIRLEAETIGATKPRMTVSAGADIHGDGSGIISFHGAELETQGRARFRNLEWMSIDAVSLRDPSDSSVRVKVTSSWSGALVNIEEFKGASALYASGQHHSLSGVWFLNNEGYPLNCSRESLYGDLGYYGPETMTTCQLAIRYSRFEGNYFNAPVVRLSATNGFSDGLTLNGSTNQSGFGTNAVYFRGSLSLSGDYSSIFNIEIKRFREILSRDENGLITEVAEDDGTTQVSVLGTDARFMEFESDLPIFVRNSSVLIQDSTLRSGIRVYDDDPNSYPYYSDTSSIRIWDTALELDDHSLLPWDGNDVVSFLAAVTQDLPVFMENVTLDASTDLDVLYLRRRNGDPFTTFATEHDGTPGYLFHNGLLSIDDDSDIDLEIFDSVFVNQGSTPSIRFSRADSAD